MEGRAVFSKGADSPYAIHSVVEIISILKNLMRLRQLLQLSVPATGTSMMLGLQQVSAHGLIIDYPGDALARRFDSAEQATLETSLDGVLVYFPLTEVKVTQHDGRMALQASLPTYLLHMQRRDSFRVNLPATNPLVCRFSLNGRDYLMPVDDLGSGGLGMFDDNFALPNMTGQVLRQCYLDLPQTEAVAVDLRVVQSRMVRMPNGKLRQRLGCAFEGEQSLRAKKMIQRYINLLEREVLAKRRGWV